MSQLVRTVALAIVSLALAIACMPAAPAPPSDTPAAPSVAPAAAPTAGPNRVPTAPISASATATPRPPPTPEPRSANTPTPVAQLPGDVRITEVAGGLNLPVALTFAPDRRLFFNEVKTGAVRILDADGTLRPEPFARLEVPNRTEQGVLGLALDPDFATNRYVYVFHTEAVRDGGEPEDNRVVRYTERDGRGTNRTKIVDKLPVGLCCHNGGRIGFGPDGKLYVTVGDQNRPERAQSPKHLHGKVLRLNPDGTIPSDNPIAGSPIFALGFRNPWGLAFHPRTGLPYVTENGDVGHDEVNRVVAGGNYGSPEVDGIAHVPGFVDPIWESGAGRLALTGAAFYTGQAMPQYRGDLFFCAFNTGDLTRMRLGGPDDDEVVEQEVLAKQCYLDVVDGPDGALYFASLSGIHRLGR